MLTEKNDKIGFNVCIQIEIMLSQTEFFPLLKFNQTAAFH